MALQGRRLTEAHRLAQARLGAQTVARMRVIWPLLHPDNLDGTFDQWLLAAVPIIRGQRTASARLAANYLALFKALDESPPFTAVLQETVDTKALTTSLLVTGPLSIKRAMVRGVPLERAVDIAEAASSAAAMRHSLEGGRETIGATVRADPQAKGFVRVASGKACGFCADLAGIEFADDHVFQAHDGCSCSSEPVYR